MNLENERNLEFLPKKFVSKKDMNEPENMSLLPDMTRGLEKTSKISDDQSPLPGIDSSVNRLYLSLRNKRNQSIGDLNQANENLVQNNVGSLLAQTSSKMGTLGGKRADVANFEPLIKSIYQRDAMPALNQIKMNQMDQDYDLKRQALYEKMMGRQQKLKDSEAAQGYKAQELDLKTQRQKELERSNVEKEKLGQERVGLSRNIAEQKAENKGQAKPLSPDQLLKYGEGRNMPKLLNNFRTEMGKYSQLFGPLKGKIGDMNAYNAEAQKFSSVARLTAQAIGKYLEGGKMTDADVPKYEAMLPNIKDLPQVAEYKLNQVEQLLRDRHNSDTSALKSQGYDVSGLELNPSNAAEQPKQRTLIGQQYNKKLNVTRKTYSNGETIDEDGDTTE